MLVENKIFWFTVIIIKTLFVYLFKCTTHKSNHDKISCIVVGHQVGRFFIMHYKKHTSLKLFKLLDGVNFLGVGSEGTKSLIWF